MGFMGLVAAGMKGLFYLMQSSAVPGNYHGRKPSDMPVVARIIRNSTKDVIRAALDAKEIGVDALLITPVFYYGLRPKATMHSSRNFR